MRTDFDEFLEILRRWVPKGERHLANGAWLICPTPWIAPEAWLHAVFPALSYEDVRELERRSGLKLPDDAHTFLLHANGALIFSYQIAIWGFRKSYERAGDEAWQPYDLLSHNEETMRPDGSPPEVLYFGSDDNGANWCFFDAEGDSYRVGKTLRERFSPVHYWPTFWHWLLERSRSLAGQYDCDGKPAAEVSHN